MKQVVVFGWLMMSVTVYGQTLSDAKKMTDNERYEKATSVYKTLLTKEPTNGEVYFYFGENYFYSDNADSALALYKKGIEMNARFPLNHIGYAKILWIDGKEAEAKAMFDKTIASFSEKGTKIPAELKARTYLEMAEALIYNEKKDIPTALTYIDKAIELDTKNPDNYLLKGDALIEQDINNASEAMKMYKKAGELDPKSPIPLAKKAYMYYRAMNREAAVSTYNEAIALDAKYAPAFRGRAEAYYQMKKLDEAINDYKQYLELNNGNISARVRYAAFLLLSGKHQDALNEIQEIEKVNSEIILLKRFRGYAEYEQGKYENAKATLDAYFAKQVPTKVIATDYEYMGKVLVKMGSDSIAVDYFVKMLQKDPARRGVVAEVATGLIKDKKPRTAVRLFDAIVKYSKPEVNDYYYWGTAAYAIKMCEKADTAFTKYVELNTAYQGFLRRGRARSCMDEANKEKLWLAKSDYEKVVELVEAMDDAGKEKAKKDLEEAYFYLGFHYLSTKNLPVAKCFYTKISALNTGSERGKKATESLTSPEFKNVTVAETCK